MSGDRLWNYRTDSGHLSGSDLTGYHVAALDGRIGKVDRHSEEVGDAYLVVDTGPWIFGTRVLLPAGTVVRVDHGNEEIRVDRTKEEIKAGPEFDPGAGDSGTGYRERYGAYYAPFYGGPFG